MVVVAAVLLPFASRAAPAGDRAPDPAAEAANVVRHDLSTGRTVSTGRAPFRAGAPTVRLAGHDPDPRRPGVVIGNDDRESVFDSTAYPFSAICKVRMRFPNGNEYLGSAAMIGPRHAVTAGHVIYDPELGGWATQVQVSPGYDGPSAPFGTFTAVNLHSVSGWTTSQDPEWDFGIIELGTTVGDNTGWLGTAVQSTGNLASSVLNTAGFPADLAGGERMYYASGTPSSVTTRQLFYGGTLDTGGGQSGSALWTFDGIERTVVGIHTTGYVTENAGTRLTQDLFNLVLDVVVEPPPGTETLLLLTAKSRVRFRDGPGTDDAKLKARYYPIDVLSDGILDPANEGVTVRLAAGDGENPVFTLDIPPGDPSWTVRRATRYTWKGYVGDTWNVLKVDTRKGKLTLKRKFADFPGDAANPLALEFSCGDDLGIDTDDWWEKKPGLWVW